AGRECLIERHIRGLIAYLILLHRVNRTRTRTRTRDIDGQPRLVDKPARGTAINDLSADIANRGAGLLVVVIDVACYEERALGLIVAIERSAAVVEHPLRSRAHNRIGRSIKSVKRRRESFGRLVLRKSGKQNTRPGTPAIEGFENTEPCIGRGLLIVFVFIL